MWFVPGNPANDDDHDDDADGDNDDKNEPNDKVAANVAAPVGPGSVGPVPSSPLALALGVGVVSEG